MDTSKNTNTLVFAVVAAGLYYIKVKSDEKKTEKGEKSENVEEEPQNWAPLVVALLIIFSLKQEIQDTISKERIYNFIAISSASYLLSVQAGIIPTVASTFASLILLPAIQERNN
tara:strand:+ start:859 stop:1203 length:345 start_codon:yes stop_codon:yes gene_type:complete